MANTHSAAEAHASDIQAVARVGQICGLFGADTADLTAVEVAERLGLNRTTAYRYCTSMVAAGILDRGSRKGSFALGALMLRLGIYALGRRPIVDIAPAHLARLSTTVHMTAVLSLWGGSGPVVAVVEEDPTRAAVVTVRPGTVLGLDAAQTRVFLAHLTDGATFETLAASCSPPERAELETAVYTARRTGYSISELPGGVVGVAAPVFGPRGIAATIALLGADSGVDLSAGSATVTELLRTAADLADELAQDRPRHEDTDI